MSLGLYNQAFLGVVGNSIPFTPASLSPVAWFQLTTTAWSNSGTTQSVLNTTLINRLSEVGDSGTYYQAANSYNKAAYITDGGLPASQTDPGGSNRTCLAMTGTSTLICDGTNYSISMWVKGGPPTSSPSYTNRFFFCEYGSTTTSGRYVFGLGAASTTGLRMLVADNSGVTVSAVTGNTTVWDNAWHHIAVTDANGTVKVYVDGVQDSQNFDYSKQSTTIVNQSLHGRWTGTEGLLYFGSIGNNIVLDNKIWTSTDVSNLYAYG